MSTSLPSSASSQKSSQIRTSAHEFVMPYLPVTSRGKHVKYEFKNENDESIYFINNFLCPVLHDMFINCTLSKSVLSFLEYISN